MGEIKYPLVINAKNNSDKTQTIKLFGSVINNIENNWGNDKLMEITCVHPEQKIEDVMCAEFVCFFYRAYSTYTDWVYEEFLKEEHPKFLNIEDGIKKDISFEFMNIHNKFDAYGRQTRVIDFQMNKPYPRILKNTIVLLPNVPPKESVGLIFYKNKETNIQS